MAEETTETKVADSGAALASAAKSSRFALLVPSIEKPRSPGPALYDPSNCSLVTKSSPQYSLGKRYNSTFHASFTPGANAYDRSNYKPGKRAPAYSFGPGPVYSLPTTIGYEKHDQRKRRMPQYTIGGKTKVNDKNIVPGPSYNVSTLTRYGKITNNGYSMAPRTFVRSKNIGPGPANYDLNKSKYVSVNCPPSYSLGRRPITTTKNICPGPNAYGIKDSSSKPSAPAFSIGVKTSLKTKAASPGPANYNACSLKTYMHKAPEYSLAPRTIYQSKLIGPGANAYNGMNFKSGKSAPAYSFGVRHSPRAPPMIISCDNLK